MTDSDRLLTRASFEKLLVGEPMTANEMKRILGALEEPGITLYQATPDEMAGLRSNLLSFLNQWKQAIEQQGQ